MNNNSIQTNTLYIVATPIGNLKDITLRALEILADIDIILAEDTRVTAKLLAQLEIKKSQQLISCHDHNEEERIDYIKELLQQNKTIALVSDAGTPLISDPGYKLVKALRDDNYNIISIPGASAVITALSASGLPSDSFLFKGFLSAKKSKRVEQLNQLKQSNTTVILYESVHRLEYLLEDIEQIIPNNKMVVAKEITKRFERFFYGTAKDIIAKINANKDVLRGEFVVLLDCHQQQYNEQDNNIDIDTLLTELITELPLKKVVNIVVKATNSKKNEIYNRALEIKNSII